MAGTNILVRQKDLIAGSGISITPDTTSGNVTIAATSTAIDESRLLPTGGKEGEILSYQEGADRGNSDNVRLLLQNALTDSANGNASPAAVTAQGVTLTGDNNLLFDGNDSHVTAVLATDEIFAADKEWTIDFWMKPTANSSEWNYILTENRGDWGSHSIGLTWNKSKSVLEQDTGGYVASVIKAPNWPNNSIACAANEWHFIAVEKQKTATGWSLNYYLNGAIWLQVAFTGEFVPFTSDNPFWFGGKTTDSGRWFKGEANKLRVTAGARYGGKAFAVPDRLIDYAAPAGQPVWIEGIDRSRLLPEDPVNGDIPCYSNEPPVGVNYNDANTVLLLQGSSDNTAAASTSERLNGIVTGEFPVQSDGSLLVTGSSNYITFNDADTRRVFSGEFTLETYIKTTQFTSPGPRHDTNWCVVYRNDTSNVETYQWLLLSDSYADAGKFGIWPYPQMSGETFPKTLVNAEFQHVAIDVYMVDGVRKFTMYRNGVPYHTGNYWSTTPADWSSGVSAAMRLFGKGPDGNLSNASVMSLRVSNIARYKGVSFNPPADGKYLTPPAAGYWGKFNKSELVVNEARLLPGAPSDTTNSYWLNSGPVATQVSPASYAGSTDATWTMELSGAFEDGDISTLFDSDTTNGVSGTLGLETFGTVRWIRKDQVPYRIDRIVLRAQNSDIGAFPKTIHLSGYDKSTFGPAIVQEFNAPVWETESDTSTYATSSFTRVCTLEVNAPAFQSYDYIIALGSGSGLETTLQAFAAYQLDTETAWKQLNTATTTTAGLMAAADKVKLDALQQAATYINIATDFNTYKTAGSYFLKGAAHTNGPLTDRYAGTLVVVAPAELQYATQYFTQLYTNKTFVRTYSRDNSAWSAWNRVLVDTDLATTTVAGLMAAADKNALDNLRYATQAGAINFDTFSGLNACYILLNGAHTNGPLTGTYSGTLDIISDRTSYVTTQRFTQLTTNKSFIRTYAFDTSTLKGTWSEWSKVIVNTDIATASAAGLMAAEDKAVIAGLTARGIYPELYNVVDPIDFNQLTTQGFYFIGGGADHINYPGTNAKLPGTLTVLRRGNYLTQTFSAIGAIGTSVWERNMYRANIGDAFTITDWHRLISDADITESKARPGYFKLPGGIIVQWGAILDVSETKTFDVTLPLAFPHLGWVSLASGTSTTVATAAYFNGANALKVVANVTGAGSFAVYWIAIGY